MDDFDLATEEHLDALADRLWTKIVGVQFNLIELHLRAKLALEHHLLGSTTPSFGLDKMSAAETAAYVGVQVESLRDRSKRRALGIPEPYPIARKLFWRRSEIDPYRSEEAVCTGDNPRRQRKVRAGTAAGDTPSA